MCRMPISNSNFPYRTIQWASRMGGGGGFTLHSARKHGLNFCPGCCAFRIFVEQFLTREYCIIHSKNVNFAVGGAC